MRASDLSTLTLAAVIDALTQPAALKGGRLIIGKHKASSYVKRDTILLLTCWVHGMTSVHDVA